MYDGATSGLGMRTVMTEVGLLPQLKMTRVYTDPSVAKSFVATRGLGKMRHLEVKLLWLQAFLQMGNPWPGPCPNGLPSGNASLPSSLLSRT